MKILCEINSLTEACERCWKMSGLPAKTVAAELGIDYSAFVRMFNVNDGRHFPPDKIEQLMKLCGNVLPLEWLSDRFGYALYKQEMADVLRAIHKVLSEQGSDPGFMVRESGRMEWVVR